MYFPKRFWHAATAPGLAGLLWVGLITLPGCSPNPQEQPKVQREDSIPVQTAEVQVVPLDRTLPVVGTLYARNEATIAAQVEGQLQKTEVDFGQSVSTGQELALIDTDSYEAFALQAAANLARSRANALNREHTLKRTLQLQQSRISSTSDLETATAEAEQTRAEVKAAEATEAIAQLNLRRSRVIAPFAGRISERIGSSGDYVKIGSPLFRLVDDTTLKFIVQVPERYASQITTNQLIRFSVDNWPGECFEGKVYLISPSITVATRSFNLGALVPNQSRKLMANSFARGELILAESVPTPVVPLEAVVNFAGVTKVFVIENNVARSREIKTGRILAGRQEVLEGLKAGERVAMAGQTKLFDGAKIRLVNQPST
jgi:membrane fusion protein (multidrug efflux system)